MLWLATLNAALAAGSTVHPPGFTEHPAVDFAGVSESADVQPLDPEGKPHQVRARLLADADTVTPGGTVRVGVHLEQKENWHTYWRSPGSVGQPTVIDWDVPEGVTVGERLHPAPDFFEYEGIISYGYEDQVLHAVELQLPAEIPAEGLEIKASTAWLVCEVQCIPGEAELSLRLLPGDGQPSATAPLFDHAATTFPVDPIDVSAYAFETALSQSALRIDDEFQVVVLMTPTGDAKVETDASHDGFPLVTPIATPGWMVMDKKLEQHDDGRIQLTLDGYAIGADEGLPQDEVAGGLFQFEADGRVVRTEIEVALPFVEAGTEVLASTSPLFGDAATLDPTTAEGGSTSATEAGPAAEPPGVLASLMTGQFWSMLGLAFIGGILLNVMPCVLPVITLKLYGLVEQAGITSAERRRAGTGYTAGILATFGVLAGVIVVVQQVFDLQAGWGFQFQYPPYIIALATIVFAFGLSLFGVFEIPGFGETAMSEASDKEGWLGYFMSGLFAVLLATPCSAPFLGTGMGFAFSLPSVLLVLFFLVAGLGLAFPFLLVAWVPALYRYMPQPGAWMETFKQFLGFTLMATTVWLVDVLANQTGTDGAFGMLVFLTVVGLGCWIFGKWGGLSATWKGRLGSATIASVLAFGTGWQFLILETQPSQDCDNGELVATDELDFSHEVPWQPFSEDRVAALDGQTIFVDFTAEWCLTCKVNEKNVLETEAVRSAMAELGVVPLKADWTNRDDTITKWLKRYGKAGVPFYLVIPADQSREGIALPEVVTTDIVIEAMKEGA
jgi:thiol:disulfide interchange protein